MAFHKQIGFKLPSNVRATLRNIKYQPFHIHKDAIEIICVLDGSLDISDCALDHSLSFGDVYIFNEQDPHKLKSNKDNIVLIIQIKKSHYTNFFSNPPTTYFICDSFRNKSKYSEDLYYLRYLLSKIYFEYENNNPSNYQIEDITSELLQLLMDQFRYYYYKKNPDGSHDIIRRSSFDTNLNHYLKAYQIIHDDIYKQYNNQIKLKDIAAREYVSVSYLSSYIKESIGLTFSEVLSLARCEEAERLLCNTTKTVDQISREIGFSNRKHLAVNFRKWYAKTPTDYRTEILNDVNNSKSEECIFDYEFALAILNSYLDEY